MKYSLDNLAQQIYSNSKEKGFVGAYYDDADHQNIDQKLLLIISEICEAQETIRSGHLPTAVWYENAKPEGFGVELADALIRILDTCEALDIDIESLVMEKMNYNKTRPNKHGKKF